MNNTTTNEPAGIDLDKLEALAKAATPQNFDSAQITNQGYIECPTCDGSGEVELTADYCNYDGRALGVQFYGIGPEHLAAEAFYRAANPATILELIAQVRASQLVQIGVAANGDLAITQDWMAYCTILRQAGKEPTDAQGDAFEFAWNAARASQLEGATGTTGASVPTWEDRLKTSNAPRGYDTFFAMRDEITDLRAQLAAKGQSEPECGMCNDSGIVGFPPDQYEECPDCIKARAAAPASAQPADEHDFVNTLKGASQEATDEWIAGFVRQHFGIYGAQPDRGAAQPHPSQAFLHEPPHYEVRFGSGHVAPYSDIKRQPLKPSAATIPPASQPVAPVGREDSDE